MLFKSNPMYFKYTYIILLLHYYYNIVYKSSTKLVKQKKNKTSVSGQNTLFKILILISLVFLLTFTGKVHSCAVDMVSHTAQTIRDKITEQELIRRFLGYDPAQLPHIQLKKQLLAEISFPQTTF